MIVAWPREGFAQAGGIDPSTAIAVLAHDPVLDDPALDIALRSAARVRRGDGLATHPGGAPGAAGAAGLTAAELDRLGRTGRTRARGHDRR